MKCPVPHSSLLSLHGLLTDERNQECGGFADRLCCAHHCAVGLLGTGKNDQRQMPKLLSGSCTNSDGRNLGPLMNGTKFASFIREVRIPS